MMPVVFRTRLILAFLLFLALPLLADDTETYKALRAAKVDGRTVALSNFTFDRDAYHFTLNGALHLLGPAAGHDAVAVFLGQGSYDLTPALEAEKRQLAIWAGDDKLTALHDEFESAVFFAPDLLAKADSPRSGAPDSRASGVYDTYMKKQRRDFSTNVHLRLAQDFYNAARETVFVAYLDGRKLPPAMLVVDPLGALASSGGEQTMLYVQDEMKGGIWYSSHLRSEIESGKAAVIKPLADATRYEIETTIAPNTEVSGTTVITATPSADVRLLPVNLAAKLRLQEAAYSPASATPPAWSPATFVQEDEKDDADAAIIFPAAVKAGQPILVKLVYKGKEVLTDAGDGNYFVGARTSWYPNFGTFDDLADYELKFHVPQKNQIIAIGSETENRVEGEQRISSWRSSHPLRVAGFNYGRFKKMSTTDKESGMTVDVYTNTGTPDIINRINRILEATNGAAMSENDYESLAPSGPTHVSVNAASLAQSAMADGINTARTGNFYFGALPDKKVSITQQSEWFFGQSWPSLVYLPYLAFLDGTTRMTLGLQGAKDFVDAVGPHEMAHQWWGHEVGWRGYRDQWLSEGFAEFTAGLVLQQSGGWKTYNAFWEKARRNIVEKPRGASLPNDQAGPISQGWRLSTWQNRNADGVIIYDKGGYVLHMLRMQMWDAAKKNPDEDFAAMMHDFVATWSGRNPSTIDFQRIVEKHLTPQLRLTSDGKVNWFFNQWVYGTAIPRYSSKLTVSDAGGGKYRISGTITQSEVPNDFAVVMPLYLQFDKQTVIRFGATALIGNATKDLNVELALPRKPQAALINVNHDVLAR
jgi:hypothetical protein